MILPTVRACPVDPGRRERPSGGMGRKAEEKPIVGLSASGDDGNAAGRPPVDAQQAEGLWETP